MIRKTVARGGSVVVPAFAVERTQKFIFMLKELMESGQTPRVPVYCDSPMAIKAVEVFLKHTEEYSDATKQLIKRYGSPLKWQGFTFAQTAEESKRINEVKFPASLFLPAAWLQEAAFNTIWRSGCRSEKHRPLYRLSVAGYARIHH